jgi:hypothetical protein
MPALTGDDDEPDEETREYADADVVGGDTMVVRPGELAAGEPEPRSEPHARRARLVLIAIVVLLIVAALVVWAVVAR